MKNLNAFDWIVLVVLIIGGINWGMIGMFNIDLVSALFGVMGTFTRIVYSLIGLSALYTVYIVSAKSQ